MDATVAACSCDYCNMVGEPCWRAQRTLTSRRVRMIVDTTDIEIGDIIDGDRLVADITSSAAYDDQVIVMVDAHLGPATAIYFEISDQVEILR